MGSSVEGGERFIEVAINEPKNRNTVIPLSDLPALTESCQKRGEALYRSWYTFDNELREHFKIRKTVAGYRGKLYLDSIILDIDKGVETPQATLERTRAFVRNLESNFGIPEEHINVFYSGSGFHVEISELFGFTPERDMHQVVKATLTSVFPEGDVIYDATRIIRVTNTINRKTGLYKIQLSHKELHELDANAIIELAKSPRPTQALPPIKEPFLKKYIKELPALALEPKKFQDNPSSIVTCMQTVFNNGETPGHRHQYIMRMASAFKRAGVPLEGVVILMQKWAPGLEPYEVRRLVEDVFTKGYRFSCHDEIMVANCSPKCIHYKNKDFTLEVVSAQDMEKDFVRYLATDFSDTSFDLNEMYQWQMKNEAGDIEDGSYKFYPGELTLVLGDTGIGKTAWVQNICVKLKRLKILYLSLEVHQHLVYRRFIQIAHSMSKAEVVKYYEGKTNALSDDISHISVMTVSPDIKSINRLIAEVEPQLVVVDTTDGITVEGNFKETLMKENAIAVQLKQIAQLQDIIIIGVHHLSKLGAVATLGVHSGKGSSSFEQKADKVIGIEGVQGGVHRTVLSLKARDECRFRLNFIFNPRTFQFTQSTVGGVKHA